MLEGEVDILTPAMEVEETFLQGVPCVKCGTRPCLATIDARKPFAGGLLPRRLMVCPNCKLEFEPHTGIQTNLGTVPRDDQDMAKMFIGGVGEEEL
jgi:hypothetical protein